MWINNRRYGYISRIKARYFRIIYKDVEEDFFMYIAAYYRVSTDKEDQLNSFESPKAYN